MGKMCLSLGVALACALGQGTALNGQIDSLLQIMYWDMAGGEINSERIRAIESVVVAVAPDVLIVQYLPNPSDADIVLDAMTRVIDSEIQRALYSPALGLLMLVNKSRAIALETLTVPQGARTQHGIGIRVGSDWCLGILVANWLRTEPGSASLSHYESGIDLLAMAGSIESDDQCDGRVIVVGTFYATHSRDTGLVMLADSVFLSSPVVDIAGAQGNWDSVATYSSLHTASTSSGLTERTSMVLTSESLLDRVISWFVFGNDGDHYGRSVTDGVNGAVSAELARDLQVASRTLPIVIDIDVRAVSSVREDYVADSLNLR